MPAKQLVNNSYSAVISCPLNILRTWISVNLMHMGTLYLQPANLTKSCSEWPEAIRQFKHLCKMGDLWNGYRLRWKLPGVGADRSCGSTGGFRIAAPGHITTFTAVRFSCKSSFAALQKDNFVSPRASGAPLCTAELYLLQVWSLASQESSARIKELILHTFRSLGLQCHDNQSNRITRR